MPFEIVTAAPQKTVPGMFSTAQAFIDGIRDALPEGHTQTQFNDRFAQDLKGEMRTKKKAETVRRMFWAFSWVISDMAEDDPDIHDDLFLEFVERIDALT